MQTFFDIVDLKTLWIKHIIIHGAMGNWLGRCIPNPEVPHSFILSGVPRIPGGLVVKGKLSLTALRKLSPIHKKGS